MDSALWESELDRLGAVWAALGPAETKTDITSWTADLQQMTVDMVELQRDGLWSRGPHDLMSIIGLNRWELAHSAALAWLCSPDAGHGLGTCFLETLLSLTGTPITVIGPVTTVLEESRYVAQSGVNDIAPVPLAVEQDQISTAAPGHAIDVDPLAESLVDAEDDPVADVLDDLRLTRADVVVRGAGWCLVIEVKVDATEQPQQAQRLYDGWSDEGDVRFIFLTRGGLPPQTIAEHQRSQWLALSWRDVRSHLADLVAGQESSAATARPALLDYLRTLRTTF